ncbi:FAD-binding oxidoreductase [Piscinibacter sp. XHJ-5]|uniref:NAD(P)/FAD-dependent oxidoreductase n=1 Tax=Piscinibacter sp. XHJ-5 TaxID=3037797 RepID=UPI00245334E2|nr:FAD-binding oxidoreductase [Piscinibacter sp. XHJ-5]
MSFLSADRDLSRNSYYATTTPRRQTFASLNERIDCDVAVVGGGLAGLSGAVELADRGYQVALLEARQVGWGASGRNGGQVIAGLACDQTTVEALVGVSEARRIWAMTLEAVELVHARRRRFGIECEWQSGFLSVAVGAKKARELQRWQADMADHYGHETTWIARADLPQWIASPRYHAGLYDVRSGHLNPLKYCLGLAEAASALGVRIFENSPATRLVPGPTIVLKTDSGEVRAQHVLLAGNVYLHGLAPVLEPRIMPVGTYIAASQVMDPALASSLLPSRAAVSDTNFALDYFRPTTDHRLLYGGRVSYSTTTPPGLEASMQRRMARTFPQLRDTKVEYAWGGFVDISMNRAPDFGRLADLVDGAARGFENVYYLQGFSGHGLALTGLAGKLVAEAIEGNASRFDAFARIRHRPFPGGRLLRMPALVAGMAYYRLKDML